MSPAASTRVAVIGAGIAGVTCARFLADAGHSVEVFDKSRGPGGRLATRRVDWVDGDGVVHKSAFDHGAPGFAARSPDFVRFAEEAHRDGSLARWAPGMAPGSNASTADSTLWVPVPDMPSLCRRLSASLPVHLCCTVDALRRGPEGWHLGGEGAVMAGGFSAVVLAIPPRQSAPLLQPHRPDWALRMEALPMSPGWTLMGVTDDAESMPAWDLACPAHGPLSCIVRTDARPGRVRLPGLGHWVVHASTSWSQKHLESPAIEVQAALQGALSRWLGHSPIWRHAAVHRWRYASIPRVDASAWGCCWWDPSSGLGVCGDALGGAGVEGAWTSGRALATALIARSRAIPAGAGLPLSMPR